jgi:ATP-dependent RNA helicase DDX46/PRP5
LTAFVLCQVQTVMFSATFPSHVEALARAALTAPVEVVVGGRSMASSAITQVRRPGLLSS